MRLEATINDQAAALAKPGKALALEDRLHVVDVLLESLNEQLLSEIDAAWNGEVARHLVAYHRGNVQAIHGDQVLTKARALTRR